MAPNMYHPLDAQLEHRAVGSAALSATTTLATIEGRAAQRTPYRTLLNIESVSSGQFDIVVEVSNDDFSTVEVAAERSIGVSRTSSAPDHVAGDDVEILWTTEVNGQGYKDARIRAVRTAGSMAFGCFSSVLGDV